MKSSELFVSVYAYAAVFLFSVLVATRKLLACSCEPKVVTWGEGSLFIIHGEKAPCSLSSCLVISYNVEFS